MTYKHIVFDIDNTLIHREFAVLQSLKETILEVTGRESELSDLTFALGITGKDALEHLGIRNIQSTLEIWENNLEKYRHTMYIYEGIKNLLEKLAAAGYQLGIVTSKTRSEYERDFGPFKLEDYFDIVVCANDTEKHKPNPALLQKYMQLSNTTNKEILYIGDSVYDIQCTEAAGVDSGLAIWGCHSVKHIRATHYFIQPYDVWNTLSIKTNLGDESLWLSWAMELQSIAQAGLTYSRDNFDLERFERVREIAAEIMSHKSEISIDKVKNIFCNETGYQTPKLDTRAAIFSKNKILLVKESNGKWSLPGGWVDVNESIRSNVLKEVKEEAGLDVVAKKVIAIQDRNKHNTPIYAYGICKIFVLCDVIEGEFKKNIETIESKYFAFEELPELSEEKNNIEQIRMCFDAYYDKNWQTLLD